MKYIKAKLKGNKKITLDDIIKYERCNYPLFKMIKKKEQAHE